MFGTVFSDVEIVRSKDGTSPDQILKIPISYAPKDKILTIIKADPTIQRPFAIQLPTMSFEYLSMVYDPSRKLNTLGKSIQISASGNTKTLSYQYNPVPYNFQFNLYIYVKNTADGCKIIEQIVPFFTPDWTPTVELVNIPNFKIEMNIPIILNSIEITDKYEDNFVDRQVLTYTLGFTVKGYLYGPVREQPVIKFANTTFYIPTPENSNWGLTDAIGNTAPSDRVTVQPGQLANGQPTSNVSLTIPYDNVLANTDFGYCVVESGDTLLNNFPTYRQFNFVTSLNSQYISMIVSS